MGIATTIMVALFLCAIGVIWYLVQRYLRQSAHSDMDLGDNAAGANEISAFIAAYRSGRIDPETLQPAAPADGSLADTAVLPTARQTSAPPISRIAVPGARTPPRPPSAKPAPAGALLRPEVKLAYLSLRAGLRDHHVFPNVPLVDLGTDDSDGRIDLIVCNPGFVIVAAIDVSVGPGASDTSKDSFLRSAGIRYLRFNTKAMPRPGDMRNLIYRT